MINVIRKVEKVNQIRIICKGDTFDIGNGSIVMVIRECNGTIEGNERVGLIDFPTGEIRKLFDIGVFETNEAKTIDYLNELNAIPILLECTEK